MDSTDLQPGRRTSSMALLAAGSLTGLVLGFGGMAFAAETPATSGTGASSAQRTATTDEDAATEGGAAADELCDEPGGRAGADDGTADDSTADDSTADDGTADDSTADGSADATASTTSAAA